VCDNANKAIGHGGNVAQAKAIEDHNIVLLYHCSCDSCKLIVIIAYIIMS